MRCYLIIAEHAFADTTRPLIYTYPVYKSKFCVSNSTNRRAGEIVQEFVTNRPSFVCRGRYKIIIPNVLCPNRTVVKRKALDWMMTESTKGFSTRKLFIYYLNIGRRRYLVLYM